MTRLTYKSISGKWKSCVPMDEALDLLSRYEDTRMTPEQITGFVKRWETAAEVGGLIKEYGLDRIKQLLKAEEDKKHNPALTIEELLEMDGEPVFYEFPNYEGDEPLNGWGIVYIRRKEFCPDKILILTDRFNLSCWDYNSEKSFKAYRRKRQEET